MARAPVFFISATTHDLGSYRETVAQALRDRELQVVIMDHFPPDHRQIREMLRDKLAPCDAVVCLIGFHFGSEPPGGGSPRRSYTQWEYVIAREMKKPVYLFFAAEKTAWDSPLDEPADRSQCQLDFRRSLVATGQRRDSFSNRQELRDLALRIPVPKQRPVVALSIGGALAAIASGLVLWTKPWQPGGDPPADPGAQPGTVTVFEAVADSPFVNSLGMRFVPVPGAPTGGALLSVWETRTSDWTASGVNEGTLGKPDEPVRGVSPRLAIDFCLWLTEEERRTGTLPPKWAYRLPTADEWTAAAALADGSIPTYPWGNDWPPPPGLANLRGGSNGLPDDPYPELAPVGSFAANPGGFHDLAGNVWEICTRSPGPPVIRGGSHRNSQERVFRLDYLTETQESGDAAPLTGFRCVLAPEE